MANVNNSFGDLHVLRDVNLTVDQRQTFVVIGPSESAKSTLRRCIHPLDNIDPARIAIQGVELPEEGKALARLRADIGMVFQSFNLFPHKTILQNVTLGPLKVRGKSKTEANDKAMDLLRRVGIEQKA